MVHIDDVLDGQTLAEDVFTNNGQFLVSKNTIITDSIRDKLRRFDIYEIGIKEDTNVSFDLNNIVYKKSSSYLNTHLKKIFFGCNSPIDHEVKNFCSSFGDELLSDETVLRTLKILISLEDDTFNHSIKCFCIALIYAFEASFPLEFKKELAVGALLHDIGKTEIPYGILGKENSITDLEYEEIQKHTFSGYNILKQRGFSETICRIALEHHERYNGSGYPRQLVNEHISLGAQIVSAIDVFIALTSNRPHRKQHSLKEAYEYFMGTSNHLFDADVIKSLFKNKTIYQNGRMVILNTGESGIIQSQSQINPLRPSILIMFDCNRQPVTTNYIVDLSERNNFKTEIIKIL